MSRPSPSRDRAWHALAALLAVVAGVQLVRDFDPGASIDFYQFWGVAAARAGQPELATPWLEPEPYRAALEERFADEERPAVLRVHRYRMRAFEPFGSPLLYLTFAAFPGDYVGALALFRVLQTLAFVAGVVLLGRCCGWSLRWILILPSLLLLLYRPLQDDLWTGNVNAVQLGALSLLLTAALRLRDAPPGDRARRGARVLLGGIALALFKANLAPAVVGVLLGLPLGRRDFARACARAAPGVLILLAAPCLYFGSASTWLDWSLDVFAAEPARLAEYAVGGGNTATPRLLAELLGLPLLVSSGGLTLLLGASLARLPRRCWRDPRIGVGLGIVGVLAAAPLVWFHYFVLALAPGLWLAGSRRAGRLPRLLAAVALVILSGAFLPVVPRALLPALYALWSLTWIPLWVALWVRAGHAPQGGA